MEFQRYKRFQIRRKYIFNKKYPVLGDVLHDFYTNLSGRYSLMGVILKN